MPKEGTRTKNGYVWRGGEWVKIVNPRRFPKPSSRRFGEADDEGILQDVAPLIKGRFEVDVIENGEVVDRYSEDNLIVDKAPFIMANALGGVSHPDYTIGGVQWGTGGHVSGDPDTPIPPSADDLALETLILETSISSTVVGETYVQFETRMSSTQGNGNVFTEAGLVISGSTKLMFARKTFPGITKSSDRVLAVRWIISFLQNTAGSDCQGVGVFGQLSPIRQYRYTVPVSPSSYTEITVPLTWTPGLNRLWVFRNGKRVFNGAAYDESYPTGIINISPPLVAGEVWTFEVIE